MFDKRLLNKLLNNSVLVLFHHRNEFSMRKQNVQPSLIHSLHLNIVHLDDSTDDDDEDDDDESSSTYATTTDEQHNKESSISPIPTSFQNHHYQNPPTVESIIKSNQTLAILIVRAFIFPSNPLRRYSSPTITIDILIRLHSSQSRTIT